jgi:hypothetical protein
MPDTLPVPSPLPAPRPTHLFGLASRRFADRPSMASVALDLLETRLGPAVIAAAPHAKDLPGSLALGQGVWRTHKDAPAFMGYRISPLSSAVVARFLAGTPPTLGKDTDFLTAQMGSEYPRHLTIDMAVVNEEIDLAGRFIMDAWSEAMTLYWGRPDASGQSPWFWLVEHLRGVLRQALQRSETAGTLSQAEHDLAAATLGLVADASSMTGQAAWLAETGKPIPPVVITGPGSAPAWLMYSTEAGFTRFESAAAFAEHVGQPVPVTEQGQATGNDFLVRWAAAILEGHLARQRATALTLRASQVHPYVFEAVIDAFPPAWVLDSADHVGWSQVLRNQLPEWLSKASDVDQLRYALGLHEVLASQRHLDDAAFVSDIPTPEDYARQRLISQAALEHPDAPLTEPDDVVVSIFSRADDDLISIAGGGSNITLQERKIGLIELSLLNTGGRPAGWMRVGAREGKTMPAWLDEASAIALVKTINVGEGYLKMLHDALMAGHQGALRRATFETLARAQLPLLALELRLRALNGFDERGVGLVRRLFAPDKALPAPILAQLGLQAAPGLPPDPVTGMFVFHEPEAGDTLVLYAPLSTEPLRQFNGRAQLMEAIIAEPALQYQVLVWLSDTARVRYEHGALCAPHWLRFGQGDEFAPTPTIAPATLSLITLGGNPLDVFYEGVVAAITLAADRQTVSNAESFWISAQEVGWLLFNQVLPFLSGSAATTAWLIQLSHSLEEHFNKVGVTDTPESLSTNELLFDLMLALASEAGSRAVTLPSGQGTGAVEGALPHVRPPVEPLLDTRWSTPRAHLTTEQRRRVQALAVPRPAELSSSVPSGPLQGLMQAGQRWLARIDDLLFDVTPGEGEAIVLDPVTGAPSGPRLWRDEVGRWRFDLRLRLRGGGPKRRIAEQRELNQQRRLRARQCLAEVEITYRTLHTKEIEGQQAIEALIKANDREGAHARRLVELQRVEVAFDQCLRLRTEYEAIGSQLALAEYGRDLSVLLSAEVNLCGYHLSLNREMLLDMLQSHKALDPVVEGDAPMSREQSEAWFAFLHAYIDIAEAGVRWRLSLDERFRQLRALPVAGPAALAKLEPKMASFRNIIEYRSLSIYTELSLLEEPLLGDESLRLSVHESMRPLVIGLTTHKEMTLDPALVQGKAIELLDGVIQTYLKADDTLHWLKQTLQADYVSPRIDRLLEQVASLRIDAEAWLSRLIREASTQTTAPTVPVPGVSTGGRRVIRTRNRGTVVAKIRPVPDRPAEEIAEIVSPLDNSVVMRFEQDPAQGDWIEKTSRVEPAKPATADIEELAQRADRELANAARQLQQAPRLAKATHIPVELEELMAGAARTLQGVAEHIEHALTLRNETDLPVELRGSAERKAGALRNMAAQLTAEGHRLRISLTKTSLPTVAKVRYLVEQGEAAVHRLGGRVALKGQGKRKDIVQEYVVRETNGVALWYAHFHYADFEVADGQYLAAHLKTLSQRFLGIKAQLAQAASDAEVVKIYRSRIDAKAARELFLNHE